MTPGDLNNPIQVCVADENGVFIPLFTAWVKIKTLDRRCVFSSSGVGSRSTLELVAYKLSKLGRNTPFIYDGNWYVVSGTNDIDSNFIKLTAGRVDKKSIIVSSVKTTVSDKNVVTGNVEERKTISGFLLQKYIGITDEESHSEKTERFIIMISPNAGVKSGDCVEVEGVKYSVGAKVPNTDAWNEFEIYRESDL